MRQFTSSSGIILSAIVGTLAGSTYAYESGKVYVGLDCSPPPEFGCVAEDVWADDPECPDDWFCLSDNGASPCYIATAEFRRCAAGCAAEFFEDEWTVVGGIRCDAASYEMFNRSTGDGCDPFSLDEGVITTPFLVVDGGGELRIRDGVVVVTVSVDVNDSALRFLGADAFTPEINLGTGTCIVELFESSAYDLGNIRFGHIDGADHQLRLDSTSDVIWNAPINQTGADAQSSFEMVSAGAFFPGLAATGANSHYDVSITDGGFMSCNGDFIAGGAGTDVLLDGGGSALILGTNSIRDGSSLTVRGGGVFDADFTEFRPGSAGEVSGDSTMIAFFSATDVHAGASLQIDGATHSGDIDIVGGTLELGPDADVFGGIFGTEGGRLGLRGVSHGESLTVSEFGDFDSNVDILDFLAPGVESGRLVLTGAAELGGELTVNLEGAVSAGDEFVIIAASSISGEFGGQPAGWSVAYGSTEVTLIADEDMTGGGSTPGDITGDGVVDVADLLALLAAWGPCADPADCPEDLDGNGFVDVVDLLEVLGNWTR